MRYRLGRAHCFSGVRSPSSDFPQVVCIQIVPKVLSCPPHLQALLSSFPPVYWTPSLTITSPQTKCVCIPSTTCPPAPPSIAYSPSPLTNAPHPRNPLLLFIDRCQTSNPTCSVLVGLHLRSGSTNILLFGHGTVRGGCERPKHILSIEPFRQGRNVLRIITSVLHGCQHDPTYWQGCGFRWARSSSISTRSSTGWTHS